MMIAAIRLDAASARAALPASRIRSSAGQRGAAPLGLLLRLACGAAQGGLLLALVLLATVHGVLR